MINHMNQSPCGAASAGDLEALQLSKKRSVECGAGLARGRVD